MFQNHLYSNMVLLTVVTNSNPHTLYFDHPIKKPSYIRLLSASLYNSWNNLNQIGRLTVYDKDKNPCSHLFFPGFYTLETLSYTLENVYKKVFGITIPTQINQPTDAMVIYNETGTKILLDEDLANFLGYDRELNNPVSFITRLNSPTTYFVHCDLIDKKQNLLNGKPSTVLARFDIRGQPFEKVHYQTPQQHVLRDTDSGDYVNSITLSVQDENGNLFDFNNQPLEFEVEINENPIYTHQHERAALSPFIQRGSTTIPYARDLPDQCRRLPAQKDL